MSKFSIILPVRNGENHIHSCISSILSQTFPDLDLLILENASTDNTLPIIQSFNDKRISVFSASVPLSIEENWGRILNLEKSEFMTLIGHDDLLDSNYLSVMNGLINSYPDATLYHAHFRYIDSQGKVVKKCKPMKGVQQPDEVIFNFLNDKTDLMGTGFMMRSSDYNRVGGMPLYPNLLFADMELFINLVLPGYLAVSGEECFSFRIHQKATTSTSSDFNFLSGFDNLVHFFYKLKSYSPAIRNVIEQNSPYLLNKYCQGITHKILKTPKRERKTPPVTEVIEKFRVYGQMLTNSNSFEPLDNSSIKWGKVIDENAMLHSLFLLFKKLYNQPVLSGN